MPTLDQLIDARRHGKELSLGHSGEVWFLTEAIDRYLAIRTPFEDFLEAPEVVIKAYGRHADDCNEAAMALRRASYAVLEEVFAAVPGDADRE